MMAFCRTLLHKIQSLLLGIVRILRKAFCCRRRRQDAEVILPLTMKHNSIPSDVNKEISEFDDWDAWDKKNQGISSIKMDTVMINMDQQKSGDGGEELSSTNNEEDFFKDMIPQFRKPKKLIVKVPEDDSQARGVHSSRLAMNPDTITVPGPELGLLEDNPTNWDVCEDADELWDPDSLIKEKKIAEREKRIAEHQRRKHEKEALRLNKKTVFLNKD